MGTTEIIIGVIIVAIVIGIAKANKSISEPTEESESEKIDEVKEEVDEVKEISENNEPEQKSIFNEMPYKRKRVLSNHEKNFYKALKPIADELNLILMCQVNLSELVYIPKGTENYMSWFGYLRERHVDFVLCNQDFSTAVVIELDDSSHDREKRKERDEKVNKILESAGIKIIHFRNWTPEQVKKEVTEIVKPPIAV